MSDEDDDQKAAGLYGSTTPSTAAGKAPPTRSQQRGGYNVTQPRAKADPADPPGRFTRHGTMKGERPDVGTDEKAKSFYGSTTPSRQDKTIPPAHFRRG